MTYADSDFNVGPQKEAGEQMVVSRKWSQLGQKILLITVFHSALIPWLKDYQSNIK